MKGTYFHVNEFYNRILTGGYNAKDLVSNSCFFHKSCYTDHGNIYKRKREKQRLGKKKQFLLLSKRVIHICVMIKIWEKNCYDPKLYHLMKYYVPFSGKQLLIKVEVQSFWEKMCKVAQVVPNTKLID